MKSAPIRFTVSALIVALNAASALASNQSNEVYAATDSSEIQPALAGATAVPRAVENSPSGVRYRAGGNPAATRVTATASAEVVEAPESAPMAAPAASAPAAKLTHSSATETASFDAVPQGQAGPIAERLKVVENLILKYGRAYDYRVHTLKELQAIQRSLEESSRRKVAKAAAAPSQVQQGAVGPRVRTENAEDPDLRALPAPAEMEPAPAVSDEE